MKCTFILQDKTDMFYNGSEAINYKGLLQEETHLAKFLRLEKLRADGLAKGRIGNQSFRDRVELNQKLRGNPEPSFTLEPRRGYKLATFIFA